MKTIKSKAKDKESQSVIVVHVVNGGLLKVYAQNGKDVHILLFDEDLLKEQYTEKELEEVLKKITQGLTPSNDVRGPEDYLNDTGTSD